MVRPLPDRPGHAHFTWLLQCDFGGLMPLSLLNLAMPYAIKLFTCSLRKQVRKVQQEKDK